jgi:hypothetical protein
VVGDHPEEQDRDLRAEKISNERQDTEADYAHPRTRSLGPKLLDLIGSYEQVGMAVPTGEHRQCCGCLRIFGLLEVVFDEGHVAPVVELLPDGNR